MILIAAGLVDLCQHSCLVVALRDAACRMHAVADELHVQVGFNALQSRWAVLHDHAAKDVVEVALLLA